jgi:hypothetical protein
MNALSLGAMRSLLCLPQRQTVAQGNAQGGSSSGVSRLLCVCVLNRTQHKATAVGQFRGGAAIWRGGGAAHVVCGNYEWAHRDALGQDSGSDEAPLLVRQLAV